MAMFQHYGEQKGRKLVQDIVATLDPVVTEGHLALARSVAAGEYWVALNNYTNLTINVKMSGAPTDYWAMDPVALIFGSVGVAANAPNPNAARLLANFALSREGQTQLTKRGRLPTRKDTPSNPPDATETLLKQKVIGAVLSAAEQKKWQRGIQHAVQEEVGRSPGSVGTRLRCHEASADDRRRRRLAAMLVWLYPLRRAACSTGTTPGRSRALPGRARRALQRAWRHPRRLSTTGSPGMRRRARRAPPPRLSSRGAMPSPATRPRNATGLPSASGTVKSISSPRSLAF